LSDGHTHITRRIGDAFDAADAQSEARTAVVELIGDDPTFNGARFLARRDRRLSDGGSSDLRRDGAKAGRGDERAEATETLTQRDLPAGRARVREAREAKAGGDAEDKGAGAQPDWRLRRRQHPGSAAGDHGWREPEDPAIALKRQEGFQGAVRRKRRARATTRPL
jgi:hypothetical protein